MHLTQVAPTGSMVAEMEDYPRTLQEFEARFSTEEGCREYLFRLRWPAGFAAHVADVERRGRCGPRCSSVLAATLRPQWLLAPSSRIRESLSPPGSGQCGL